MSFEVAPALWRASTSHGDSPEILVRPRLSNKTIHLALQGKKKSRVVPRGKFFETFKQ